MKLFMIMYTASGIIAGYVGPLPPQEEAALPCIELRDKMRVTIKQHPEIEQFTFECEWRDQKPELQVK